MARSKDNTARAATDEQFVVNGRYLRTEARAAIRTFVAPLSGLYEAVTGNDRHYSRRESTSGHFRRTEPAE